MARAIKKIVNKTTYTYACVYCSKEYDTEHDAEICEEQHVLDSYKKNGNFIWIETEKDAQAYAEASGAWLRGQAPAIARPGWYYPDIYEAFEDEPHHIQFYTPEQMIAKWEKEKIAIQRQIDVASALLFWERKS